MSESVPSLTPTQIQALVVLMAEARDLTNAQLKELAGFDLSGDNRTKLVKLGLITSVKSDLPRKPFVHSLTDRGWHVVGELHNAPPKVANSAGRTLLCLLGNVSRSLEKLETSHGDFFSRRSPLARPADVATVPSAEGSWAAASSRSSGSSSKNGGRDGWADEQRTEDAIRAAYFALRQPGEWLPLAALRAELADVGRPMLDNALLRMLGEPGVRIIPAADSKNVGPADREAALRIGDHEAHVIAITAGTDPA